VVCPHACLHHFPIVPPFSTFQRQIVLHIPRFQWPTAHYTVPIGSLAYASLARSSLSFCSNFPTFPHCDHYLPPSPLPLCCPTVSQPDEHADCLAVLPVPMSVHFPLFSATHDYYGAGHTIPNIPMIFYSISIRLPQHWHNLTLFVKQKYI
jgi:hypothetical protein